MPSKSTGVASIGSVRAVEGNQDDGGNARTKNQGDEGNQHDQSHVDQVEHRVLALALVGLKRLDRSRHLRFAGRNGIGEIQAWTERSLSQTIYTR